MQIGSLELFDQSPSGSAVNGIIGTLHQVLANGTSGVTQTGIVTLAFPNGISIGSYQAIAPPAGGIAAPGHVLIGTSTDDGTHLLQVNGGIKAATIQLTTGAMTNYVLTSDAFGNGSWEPASTSSVLSVTGTTNQILASPTTGNVVVSLTNGISLGSYQAITPPTGGIAAPGHVLIGTSTDDMVHLLQVNGGITAATIQLTTGAMANYVLTSDAFGNGSWEPASTSSVLSVTGTTNQILASPTTGNVVVSFTNGISIGSYQAITPPVGGIIAPEIIGFGTSSPGTTTQVVIAPSSATLTSGLSVNPTFTATSGTLYGEQIIPAFNPPTGDTYTAVYGSYVAPTITPSGSGTVTTAYGAYIAGPVVASNTVTTAYGLFVAAPSGAGTITAGYAASIQGGLAYKLNEQAASYTVTTEDYYVGVTSTSSARTVTLPATPPTAGWTTVIKDESGGAATNNITISGNGHNIDGAATLVISTNYGAYQIYSNGTQYYSSSFDAGSGTVITGTTNQITATPSTGNVVLSFSSGLSLGAYQPTLPPTGGLIAPGIIGFGTPSPGATAQVVIAPSSAILTSGLFINPTFTATSGTLYGEQITPAFNPPTGDTYTAIYGSYIAPTITPTGSGTVTTAYGAYVAGPVVASNTVTTAYGLFVAAPSGAGTITAGYAASIQGGLAYKLNEQATNYQVTTEDYYVGITSTASARTVTLPATPPTAGWTTVIKDESGAAATHNITISGNGQNIDGAATLVISTNYGAYQIYSNGTQYYSSNFDAGSTTVYSVTGTTNQITASPTTGNVVLAFSSGLSLGTYQSTTPPTGGLIAPGIIGFGTSAPGTTTQVVIAPSSATLTNSLLVNPTYTATSGTLYGAQITPTFEPPSGDTYTAAYGLNIAPTITPAGTGTVTTAYGAYVAGPSVSSNTVTTAYGLYVAAPSGAGTVTNPVALYSDNAAVGYTATKPPSSGLIVSGIAGFGTSAPGTTTQVVISPAISATITSGLVVSPTYTSTSGTLYGEQITPAFNPPTGDTYTAIYGLNVAPTITPVGSGTVTTAYGAYVAGPVVASNTVTTAYGLFVSAPSGAGTITAGYAASIQGGLAYKLNEQAASYQVTTEDYYVGVTSTASARTVTLPATPPTAGWTTVIKDESGGAASNNITISGNGHNIDGAATLVIDAAYGAYQIYSNGAQYYSTSISGAAEVFSVTGTTNQITATPSTGNVVLAFSSGISLGSYQPTTPPTGGLIAPGIIGFGTSTPGTTTQVVISPAISATITSGLVVSPTYTSTSGTLYGEQITPAFNPPTGDTYTAIYGLNVAPTITPAGSGTVTTAYGAYVAGPVVASNTVTTAYGLYVAAPSGAGTITAGYAASIQGGLAYKLNEQAASYQVTTEDYYVGVTSTSSARTVTLPATPPTAGWTTVIKDESGAAATNNITISGNGQNIDGAATLVISTNYGAYQIYSNGTQYYSSNFDAGSSTVYSVTGTVNQITASPTTGNVVLAFSSGLSLGTYQSTTPPTGGLIAPGIIGFGTSAPGTTTQVVIAPSSATLTNSLLVNPTYTATSGTLYGAQITPTFEPPSGDTYTAAYGLNIAPTITPAGTGTVTTAYGAYVAGPSVSSNTVTTAYGLYVAAPSGAGTVTNAAAFYSDNAAVGYTATTPPPSGLIVSGRAGFGTSAPASTAQVSITPAINATITSGLVVNPTYTSTSGTLYGEQITPAFNPPTGDTYTAIYGLNIAPTITPAGSGTVTTAYSAFIAGPVVASNTVTTAYSLFVSAPSGAGTITAGYAASIQGGLAYKLNEQAASYQVTTEDYYVGVTSTASARTVTLPATPPTAGWTTVIKDESGAAATNNITISGNGQNIDGAATLVISTNYGAYQIYSNGTQYYSSNFDAGSSTVYSVTGTVNQITASPTTGNVVLAFSSGLSLGTYQSTTPPTGGLIAPGIIGFGTSAPGTTTQVVIAPSSATLTNSLLVNPTYTATSGTLYGAQITPTFEPPTGDTYTAAYGLNVAPTITPAGTGTVTTAYGAFIAGPSVSSNTVTTAYGLYVAAPSGAGTVTNAAAFYSDNAAVGYTATTPPPSGLIVSGRAGFGTSAPASTAQVSITPAINATITSGLVVNPTYTSTSGTLYGEQITPAFNPPTGDTYTAIYGLNIAPTITPAGSGTVTTAYSAFIAGPVVASNTVTTAYSLFVSAPSGAGTITAGYAASIQGGLAYKLNEQAASYQVTTEDYYVGVTSTSSARTVTLPATPPTAGWTTVIKDESGAAATNNITISGNGQNIDGAATLVISTNYGAYQIYSNGTQYYSSNFDAGSTTVYSVTGTTNQITASPTTGNVVLAFSSGLSLGSYQPTTPPTGGLIAPGIIGFGTSAPGTTTQVVIAPSSATLTNSLLVNPTYTATSGTLYGAQITPTFEPPTGDTYTAAYGLNVAPTITPAGTGTVTTAYGAYVAGPSVSSNTVTTAYGLYVAAPSGAGTVTNPVALYSDNAAVGYTATKPPSSGLIVSGIAGFGTSAPGTTTQVVISPAISATITSGLVVSPTYTSTSGTLYGEQITPAFNPPTGDTYTAIYGLNITPTITPAGTGTVTTAYGAYVAGPVVASNTVTTAYGLYVAAPSGAGTVTNPVALYSDNAAVGYTATKPPSSGLIVSGIAGFGTSAPGTTTQVVISPAISSTITSGLVVSPTYTSTSGTLYGEQITPAFNPPTGDTYTAIYGLNVAPTITPAGSGTVTTAYGAYVAGPVVASNTVTTAYGLYVAAPSGAGTITAGYAASIQGGLAYKLNEQAASYQVTTEDYYVGVTSTASARTVTLPATPPTAGWTTVIKDESGAAATNNITISGNGQNIDGAATLVISTNYGAYQIYSNGTQYYSSNFDAGSTTVYSVTGTTNQITASPTTGNVVLAFSSGLSLGTYQPTTPPTGGLIAPGIIGFGTSAPGTTTQVVIAPSSATLTNSLLVNPTYTATSGTLYGAQITPTFEPPTGDTYTAAYGLNVAPTITPAGTGTVTTAYGAFIAGPVVSSNTVTTAYGLYVSAPSGAGTVTTPIALYADNVSIGYTTTPAATHGLIVEGTVQIGSGFIDHVNSISTNYTTLSTDSVIAVNTSSNAVTITLEANPATGQTYKIIDNGGNAFNNNVYLNGNGKAIDGMTTPPTVSLTITVGNSPLPGAVTPNGSFAYIPNSGASSVIVIQNASSTSPSILITIPVGTNPGAVAITPNGNYAYALNTGSNNVTVIQNASTSSPSVIATVGIATTPNDILITPNGSFAYIVSTNSPGSVVVLQNVSTDSPSELTAIAVGDSPGSVGITPNGNYVYIPNFNSNNVTVIQNASTSSPSILTTIAVGSGPAALAVSPNGNYVYIPNFDSNNVTVIQNASSGSPSVLITITVGSAPVDLVYTPNGNYVYVLNETSGNVSVIQNASSNSPSILTTLTVGTGPRQLAITSNGLVVYVTNFSSDNVTVIQNASSGSPTVLATLTVGFDPLGPTITPSGTVAYVTNTASNNVSVIFNALLPAIPLLYTNYSEALLIYDGTEWDVFLSAQFPQYTAPTTYGSYFATPAGVNQNVALYADNLSIGYAGTVPPTNGIITPGIVGIGTSSPGSTTQVVIAPSSSSLTNALLVNPTYTATSGTLYGEQITPAFNPPSGDTYTAIYGTYVAPTITPAGSGTVTTAYGAYVAGPVVASNTVTTAYGLFVAAPSGAGTITAGYAASIQGGLAYKLNEQAASYQVTTEDYYVGVTSTSSARTVTLPATPPTAGWTTVIKDESGAAATHNITISGNGNNIDGAATLVISTNYGAYQIYSNGTQYYSSNFGAGSSTVYSVTGTTNQITASPTTGNVVLAFSSGLSLGSYQSTTPPTGGLIAPGIIGFGTSAPGTTTQVVIAPSSATLTNSLLVNPTYTATSGTLYGAQITPTFEPPSGDTYTAAYGLNIAPTITPAGTGTVTTAYGAYVAGPSVSSNTVTTAYGLYVAAPSGAGTVTNPVALYSDNAAVGYTATKPPSSGLIVSGIAGFGTSAPGTTTQVVISPAISATITSGLVVSPTYTSTSGTLYGEQITPAFNPPTGDTYTAIYGLNVAPTITPAGSGTVTTAYGAYVAGPVVASNTVTTAYGLYVAAPSGAGTVTNPVALYSDNAAVGYTATKPPSSGLIVSGIAGFGTSAPGTTTQVVISPAISATITSGLVVSPTYTSTSGTLYGEQITPAFNPPTGDTYTAIYGLNVAPTITPAGSGTVTTAYGAYVAGPVVASNTVTTAYGLYVAAPSGAGTITAGYAASIQGGLAYKLNEQAASYQVTTEDYYVGVTSTASARTVTLPATPPTAGWTTVIKDESGAAATHNITISGNGQNIDGAATLVISTNYGAYQIYSNGTQYYSSNFDAGSSTVYSVTGTVNQITASPTTGNVVLAFSSGLSLGTYQSTTPPTGGLIAPGIIGFGTSAPGTTTQVVIAPSSATLTNSLLVNPTYTATSGTLYGAQITPTFEPPSGDTYTAAYGLNIAPTITPAGTGTVTTAYGAFIAGPSVSSNTVTTAYGLYVSAPSGAGTITNSVALYSDNAAVGYTATKPPSSGLIVNGIAGFGTSAPATTAQVSITPAISATITSGLVVNPTYTSTSGTLYGEQITPAFNPPTGDTYTAIYGLNVAPTITPAGSGTVTTAYGAYVAGPSVSSNTVTTAYGLYVAAPSGAGTVTNPVALYSDNAAVGYTATKPPSSGLIVSGIAGFGTSAPGTTTQVVISPAISATITSGLVVSPTYTSTSGTLYGEQITPAFNPPTGDTYTAIYGLKVAPTITPVGSGTVTTAYGAYIAGPVVASNTVTTAYSLYVAAPSGAGTITGGYAASIQGGLAYKLNEQATSYTVTTEDYYVGVTSTSSARTVTLPATPPTAGWTTVIKDESGAAATHNITISGNGQNIDGAATLVISTNYGAYQIYSNGTQYYSSNFDAGGSTVYSVTGTVNQITASPTTGNVVLAFSSGLSLGSYQATTPPTGGIIAPGIVGFGTSAPGTNTQLVVSSTLTNGLEVIGTQTANVANLNGIYVNSTFSSPGSPIYALAVQALPTYIAASGQTITNAAAFYAYNTLSSNVGTITTAYGLLIDTGSAIAGTAVTTHYGAYIHAPTGGGTKIALYSDNASIGYTATLPPPSGLIVSGVAIFGGSAVISATSTVELQASSANAHLNLYTANTGGSSNGGQFSSFTSRGTIASPTATQSGDRLVNIGAGGYNGSAWTGNTTDIVSTAAENWTTGANGSYITLNATPTSSVTRGEIMRVGPGVTVGIGTTTPQNTFDVAGNVAIGSFAGTDSAPTNGLIVSGQVALGTSFVRSSADYVTLGSTSGYALQLAINGTNTITEGNLGATDQIALGLFSGNVTPASTTVTNSIQAYIFNIVDVTHAASIVTRAIGIYSQGCFASGTPGAGSSITNAYSGFFAEPGGGTNTCALYADNLAIGVAASGTPTNGTIKTAPPASSTVTGAFGSSLTAGSSLQNTTGYDIVLNIVVDVTAATTATITLGVGTSSTPTTNTAVPSFTVAAATFFSLHAYVPNGYYVLVGTTGTITVASITVVAMGV